MFGFLPAGVAQGVSDTMSGAGGGFNPLSILEGAAGGGFGIPSLTGGGSSAASSNYQDVFSSSPFNVGSGDLTASAEKTPSFGGGGSVTDIIGSITPLAILTVAAWIAVTLIKK